MNENFPNRPDTDDFKLMSKVITALLEFQHSDETTGHVPTEFIDAEVTERAILYMARNRAIAMRDGLDLARDPRSLAGIATSWLEGFLVGAKFAEEQGGE